MKFMYFSIKYRYKLISVCFAAIILVIVLAWFLSRYVTSVSHYQSRSLMYIQGLIPRKSTELAEAAPIGLYSQGELL